MTGTATELYELGVAEGTAEAERVFERGAGFGRLARMAQAYVIRADVTGSERLRGRARGVWTVYLDNGGAPEAAAELGL